MTQQSQQISSPQVSREATYLKGVANGAGWLNLPRAIAWAIHLHENQFRKGNGEPYINHPLRVASSLLAAGIRDDIILSIAVLHDVIEDNAAHFASLTTKTAFESRGIFSEIHEGVDALTKKPGTNDDYYYGKIKLNKRTLIVKVADRCHNISTMGGAFSRDKMLSYIKETEDYIIPLCKYGKQHYPEYSDVLFVMKYHIESLMETIKACLEIDAAKE